MDALVNVTVDSDLTIVEQWFSLLEAAVGSDKTALDALDNFGREFLRVLKAGRDIAELLTDQRDDLKTALDDLRQGLDQWRLALDRRTAHFVCDEVRDFIHEIQAELDGDYSGQAEHAIFAGIYETLARLGVSRDDAVDFVDGLLGDTPAEGFYRAANVLGGAE